jgi:hypothetical protein
LLSAAAAALLRTTAARLPSTLLSARFLSALLTALLAALLAWWPLPAWLSRLLLLGTLFVMTITDHVLAPLRIDPKAPHEAKPLPRL